jgi:hypothetical protein
MKKILFILLCALFPLGSSAQVKWSHGPIIKHIITADDGSRFNYYRIIFVATIANGWHIYPTNLDSNDIGYPTVVEIKDTLSEITSIDERGTLISAPSDTAPTHYYRDRLVYVVYFISRAKDLTFYITYTPCTDEQCNPTETETFNVKPGDAL